MNFFLLNFFRIFIFATALIEFSDGRSAPEDQELLEKVNQVAKQVEVIAARRPFRLSAMNNSLEKVGQASFAMRQGESVQVILKLLEKARQNYKNNSFALLLKAIVLDVRAGPEEGNQAFEKYLLESRTFGEFEKKFLTWREFHSLRRSVYDLLSKRGVSFEDREGEIQVKVPFKEFLQFMVSPQREDVILNYLLIALTVGGGLFFIFASFNGMSFRGPFTEKLPLLYFIAWVAYGLWLADLAIGLPFGWSRYVVIRLLLGGGFVYYIAAGGMTIFRERTRPLEKGYRRCPHCGKVILELAVECSICHKKI